ncbi:MAG TPA: hypothetical protein EYQ25_11845 [Planctomycetes bacterium]|nr:hypothetical protein [Planctomycetota bacterium]HIL36795.1 hypothetical protein [Planctomycetota bacterium]
MQSATPLLSLLLLAPVLSQSGGDVETEVRFAQGLATQWAFVDLADAVLANAEKGASSKVADRLRATRCEVISAGALNERDPARRLELFEEALSCFESFLDEYGNSPYAGSAERALVEASAYYARAIEISLEEAAGEEAQTLRARQAEVLTGAVERTADLIATLESLSNEERGERQTREMYELMLNRGSMLANIGRSDPSTTYFFDAALTAYEDLVFSAGEGTLYALRAYSGMGDVFAYQGLWSESADFYAAVVETTLPSDLAEWESVKKDFGLRAADVEVRFALMQIAIPGLLKAHTSANDSSEAVRYALHFLNTHAKEGVSTTAQGYEAMLEAARTFLAVGGWIGGNFANGSAKWYETEEEVKQAVRNKRLRQDATSLAMSLATRTADENQRNSLRTQAQKLISEISSRPGVAVSPELRVAAAEGEYRSGNHPEALVILKEVMANLDGSAENVRLELGPKVLNLLGLAYRAAERPLESAYAFREGWKRYRGGDPELDRKNAESYYAMIRQVSKAANSDTQILEHMLGEAEMWVSEAGSDREDVILWRRGEKAYDKRDWQGAKSAYGKIPEDSEHWEKGYVKAGVCLVRERKYAEGIERFDLYLDVVRNDPGRATEIPARLQARKAASMEAEFFRGLSHYQLKQYQQVITLLATFYEDYPEQAKLANWTLDMIMRSQLELGSRSEARAILEVMNQLYSEESRTSKAIISFYNQLSATLEDSTDEEQRGVLLREMAELLSRTNPMGTPNLTALKREAAHWRDLGEWAEAERVLLRVISVFGEDPKFKAEVTQFRLPDLGHALIKQKKVADAKAILTPLMMNEERNPTFQMLMDWSMAISGWVEFDGNAGRLIEIPGASGTAEEFDFLTKKLNTLSNSTKRFTKWTDCEWYEVKFRFCFAYYAWSQMDARKLESFKTHVQSVSVGIEGDWDSIDVFCEQDEDETVRTNLGSKQLSTWFRWLGAR